MVLKAEGRVAQQSKNSTTLDSLCLPLAADKKLVASSTLPPIFNRSSANTSNNGDTTHKGDTIINKGITQKPNVKPIGEKCYRCLVWP